MEQKLFLVLGVLSISDNFAKDFPNFQSKWHQGLKLWRMKTCGMMKSIMKILMRTRDLIWTENGILGITNFTLEGLLAGKESSVQLGFNNGFKESVLVGYNWGLVRGITSSFAFLPEHVKEKLVEANEGITKLEALHCKVRSISGKDALKLFHKDILKGKVEASPSSSKENSRVNSNSKGNNQISESAERIKSALNINTTNELAELHRQLVSIIETTSINTACPSY